MVRRALIIAHEPGETGGQIEVRLRERGVSVETYMVVEDRLAPETSVVFPDHEVYDLIIPMGSVRSLTEKEEIGSWVHAELDLLRRSHERGIAVLGVCFGGQLIAEALGGSVERSPVTELGWYEIRPVDGGANPVGPGPWMQWHHDRFTPPTHAEVLAATDDATQLFRVGRTLATQFHPEVDVEHVGRWLASTSDDYLTEHGVSRERVLRDVRDNEARNIEQCHALVDWFLDEVANSD